ncbi:MAG: GDSL family lipase [Opitutus sp.]|nr:GDSL family lipase [Opitutus sp.]
MLRRFLPLIFCATVMLPAQVPSPDASTALPQDTEEFRNAHASFLARAKSGPVGLLFLGDSITARWSTAPELWEARYGAHHAANFGLSRDQTQNLLWRIEHGELDGLAPRVVVILIGTNNSASHPASQIVGGIEKIVGLVRAKLPESKILLLGIFPRGPRKNKQGEDENWEARMAVINGANATLPRLADGKNVHFLDVGHAFVAPNGEIRTELLPDRLHPSPAGLRAWANAMQPTLEALLR